MDKEEFFVSNPNIVTFALVKQNKWDMANYQNSHSELLQERQRLHDWIKTRSREGLQAGGCRNVEATFVLGAVVDHYQSQQNGVSRSVNKEAARQKALLKTYTDELRKRGTNLNLYLFFLTNNLSFIE